MMAVSQRFQRARDFKMSEAFEMLSKTLKWRKELNIDSILEEEDLGAELSAATYMDGVDRGNHPICYNTFGTEENYTKFLRWRFLLLEKEFQKLDLKPGGVSLLLHINDLKNPLAFWKKELRFATRKAVSVLQDNYPEFVTRNVVDDCNSADHTPVPRKLRSAMKNRNQESLSPHIQDSETVKDTIGGSKSPKAIHGSTKI